MALLPILHRHVKHDQWQRVQVYVVPNLLRGCVVLVVLVSPKRTRHAATSAVKEDLDRVVEQDVPGERVVPTFVHKPSTPSLHNPERKQPEDWHAVEHHPEASCVHRKDLGNTQRYVDWVWFEEAFILQLGTKLDKICSECVLLCTFGRDFRRILAWEKK